MDETTLDEPAVDKTTVHEPAVHETTLDEPAMDKTIVHEPAADEPTVDEPTVHEPTVDRTTMDSETTLLPANDIERYRDEWRAVQSGFVDDPQAAVREADKLLEHVVDTLTSRLAERRTALSGDGDGQETEHLRQTLRSYRSLLDQLIGV